MSRRIDIELTSAQPDGRWTWRAAGARQPKGVLEGQVLYDGAKAGDVVRAEAEFEIDGIVITSVLRPREKTQSDPGRIELLGPPEPVEGGVTTQLVRRGERRPDRRDGDRRPDRRDGDRRPGRRDRDTAGGPGRRDRDTAGGPGRPRSPRTSGPAGPEGTGAGHRDRGPGGRPRGEDGPSRPEGAGRSERPSRPRSAGGSLSRGPARGPRGDGEDTRSSATSERPRSRRLNPGSTHRHAVVESLPAEQRPVAEQILRGGIPAVRTAISLERERAVAEGRPAPNAEQLLLLAESLLPRLKTAEWHDRAEAAAKSLGDISLRDLRSVVAGADAARDDETRALAATLRDTLDTRVTTLQNNWTEEIERHLSENRVVRALRLSGRPPEASSRLPAELAERLSAAAGAALSPDTGGERWLAVLEAAAESPVRRSVHPAGLPSAATPEVTRAAHQQAARVPALAPLLGIAIPPPPGPRRPPGPAPAPAPQPQSEAVGPEPQPEAGTSSDEAPTANGAPEPPGAEGDDPGQLGSPPEIEPSPAPS